MEDVARILSIWLFCLVSVLLHELGHALGYRISTGKAGWKAIAGSGPRLFSVSRCAFCLIPVGGYFIPGEEPKTKREKLMTMAGGPCVSLLLTALFGIVRLSVFGAAQPESGIHQILFQASNFLLIFNFVQFLSTAIPMRYRVICRGFESDGLQIVHALKEKENPDPFPEP